MITAPHMHPHSDFRSMFIIPFITFVKNFSLQGQHLVSHLTNCVQIMMNFLNWTSLSTVIGSSDCLELVQPCVCIISMAFDSLLNFLWMKILLHIPCGLAERDLKSLNAGCSLS